MALKYWFEFTDVKNIVHRCEIYNDDFVGESTQVYGSLTTTKASTKDTLEVVRGGGLTIELEANTDLTFEDFYSTNERTFSVKYIRDSVTEFLGWLSPEGLYQSFVADKWILTLDCTDGLGFLKNLEYVENDTGLPFIGKQSVLEVVVNCLKRTNLSQNIYTFIDVVYDGQTGGTNTFVETFINSARFVKEDENTFMSCDEVLRSLFDLFGCCITQYKGDWLIYKPNILKDDTSLTYYAYDSDGIALSPSTKDIDISFTLGSQINDFYPHHVNANQQISIDNAIGAYRINYKYGLVKNLIENKYLISQSDTEIDGFDIIDDTYLSFPSDRFGVLIDSISTQSNVLDLTNTLSLDLGSKLDFVIGMFTETKGNFSRVKVVLTGTTNTYYLKSLGVLISGDSRYDGVFESTWTTTDSTISYSSYLVDIETPISGRATFRTDELPETGTINIFIDTATNLLTTPSGNVLIKEISLIPILAQDNLKGENHTFQFNTVNKSTKIEDTKEVYNGDNPSDIFVGTIYKSDLDTPTELWNRGNVRKIPLLQYAGEERMAMYSEPLRVFTGDVFGFIDYFSVIEIDGIDGVKFMPIEYTYEALNNVTKLKLKQILNDAGGISYTDLDYQLTFDYGNVVEPTIK